MVMQVLQKTQTIVRYQKPNGKLLMELLKIMRYYNCPVILLKL